MSIVVSNSYACHLPPVAIIYGDPKYVCEDELVEFDGSSSYDPDGGGIKKFEWDWTDDGNYDHYETPGDGKATYTYNDPGIYTVRLRVTDNDKAEGGTSDKSATDTCTVYVGQPNRVYNITQTTWYSHLQTAINGANNGDEIKAQSSTYYERIDFKGKNITLRSTEPDDWDIVMATVIDAHGIGRGVTFDQDEGETGACVLQGFTIRNGKASGTYPQGHGGGVLCQGSSPTILNCVIENNEADYGGGLAAISGSNPIIRNCIFEENAATSSSGDGGGMVNVSSSPELTNCLFIRNQAPDHAGAFRNVGNGAVPKITNCNFIDNEAGVGGAIQVTSGGPICTNCIFWGNQAAYYGDQIHNGAGSSPSFSYCDIQDKDGAGVFNDEASTPTYENNIDADPLFADPSNDDYHLKSTTGRWDGSTWVTDSAISPCVDGGDPSSDYSSEPPPNGDRINMGAYGNTAEASKSDKYHLVVYLDTDDEEALSSDMQWQLDGYDSTWRNSGVAVLVNAGSYTIKCRCDLGTYYISPVNLPITVGEGQPTSYTRTYKACGYLTVMGKYADYLHDCGYDYSNWYVDDGLGWRYGEAQKKVLPGTHTITFGFVSSAFTTPDPISNVTVTKGSTATYDRTYILKEMNVDGESGSNTNTGTPTCPLKTIQKAFNLIPAGGGTIFVCCPATFNESITFPTDRTIYIYGQAASLITVTGYHTPWPPPSNIHYLGNGIEFAYP
jgi:hypothetical protein